MLELVGFVGLFAISTLVLFYEMGFKAEGAFFRNQGKKGKVVFFSIHLRKQKMSFYRAELLGAELAEN